METGGAGDKDFAYSGRIMIIFRFRVGI